MNTFPWQRKIITIATFFFCLLLSVAQFGVAVPPFGRKKLIIGIPRDKAFDQFVDVKLKPNTTEVVDASGYSIQVFNATANHLMRLGFNVSYKFEAFVDINGNPAGSYDQLLQQIPTGKKYDAVVGDITILANRGNYVDFTLPYTESSARMLVRVSRNQDLNMWTFLRPFSWDLWVTIFMACVFIGATIRFMERKESRIAENEEDSTRQRQLTGISLILWLPLVQVVLPERESVTKNCSKVVLVVWLMLVFVLMQGYTASLSSILTLNLLQPTYLTLDDLKRNGECVGYPPESFVRDLMVDSFDFDKTKLKKYTCIEDYRDALDKGSRNGGVAAIFHEEPYIKVFLKRYGSKYYKMVGPRYHTAGFGFAFPINSSLTSHFSKAILNVTQSDEMELIERKYFGDNEDEQLQNQSNASLDTRSLTTHSFAGLFMVTGLLTFLAVLVSESPNWLKPIKLAKIYSHTCLSSLLRERINQSEDGSTNVVSTEESNNHPEIHSISPFTLPIETLP